MRVGIVTLTPPRTTGSRSLPTPVDNSQVPVPRFRGRDVHPEGLPIDGAPPSTGHPPFRGAPLRERPSGDASLPDVSEVPTAPTVGTHDAHQYNSSSRPRSESTLDHAGARCGVNGTVVVETRGIVSTGSQSEPGQIDGEALGDSA